MNAPRRRLPVSAAIGFVILVFGIVAGYSTYKQPHNTISGSVSDLVMGIAMIVISCLVVSILGMVSLIREERPIFLGYVTICVPLLFLLWALPSLVHYVAQTQ